MSNRYNPFFRSNRFNPYYYYSPEPVHPHTQPVQVNPAPKPSPSVSKVVQIPVQFVSSEQGPRQVEPARSKSYCAVTIQKVVRGFLVRKSLRKIRVIEREVKEIENWVGRREYMELLRGNERERIKVNEMLMGLLFKLDSVRGFGSGVRDCRKAVIKRAIALQEKIDAIVVARNDEKPNVSEEIVGEIHQFDGQEGGLDQIEEKIRDSGVVEATCGGDSENERARSEVRDEKAETWVGNSLVEEEKDDRVEGLVSLSEVGNAEDEAMEGGESKGARMSCEGNTDGDGNDFDASEVEDEKAETRASCRSVGDKEEDEVDVEMNAGEEWHDGVEGDKNLAENEDVDGLDKEDEEDRCEYVEKVNEAEDGTMVDTRGEEEGTQAGQRNVDNLEVKEGKEWERRDEKERNSELLGRMMEENAKMMSLMNQLFESNEMQMRMLSSLTQRVEQLEKAFVCDKMKRKKKRHGA